jgi:hypothetical protein
VDAQDASIYEYGRHDVTNRTPRSGVGGPPDTFVPGYRQEFEAWVQAVERETRNRASLERLVRARGIARPFALGSRFIRKSREVGPTETMRIAVGRLSARLRRGDS